MKVMSAVEMKNTNAGAKKKWYYCPKGDWKISYTNWCSKIIAKQNLAIHKWLFGHK